MGMGGLLGAQNEEDDALARLRAGAQKKEETEKQANSALPNNPVELKTSPGEMRSFTFPADPKPERVSIITGSGHITTGAATASGSGMTGKLGLGGISGQMRSEPAKMSGEILDNDPNAPIERPGRSTPGIEAFPNLERSTGTFRDQASLPLPIDVHNEHPPLDIFIDPGDSTADMISEFYLALSAYYQSMGGSGLKYVNEGCRTLVQEEEAV